jgi:Na+/H+ antiporter NhaD/arsenite permease-like protein
MKVALSWMSETTLALLFGMTIMLNYLADTGVLEYAAVSTARFSNGVPFRYGRERRPAIAPVHFIILLP